MRETRNASGSGRAVFESLRSVRTGVVGGTERLAVGAEA